MRTGQVIGFVWATTILGSMLPGSSSYALTYPNKAQNCASTAMHRPAIRYPPRAVEGVGSRGGQVSSAGRSDARNRRVPSTH
jgi:hypothetical protein